MAEKLDEKTAQEARNYFAELGAATRWKKGQSGNPSGKTKEPSGLTDMLRYRLGKAGARALADTLIDLARNEDSKFPARVQLDAITYIYDRLEGRPRQAIQQESTEEPLIVQLLRRLSDDKKALEGTTAKPVPIAEPTRPFVDAEVREIVGEGTGTDISR